MGRFGSNFSKGLTNFLSADETEEKKSEFIDNANNVEKSWLGRDWELLVKKEFGKGLQRGLELMGLLH